jgi:hypothetical protein
MRCLPVSLKTVRFSQRRRRALFLFAGIFLFALLVQFGVGWYQRFAAVRGNCSRWADEIASVLAYSDRWDVTRLRQADLSASHYCVIDANGLAMDIEGFVPQLRLRAAPIHYAPGLQTINVPETGESCRILVNRLRDGILMVGVSNPEDITRLDNRLNENVKHFGSSIREAMRVRAADIDRNLDYAVLDDAGLVKTAVGGIPLKLVEFPKPATGQLNELTHERGPSYGVMAVPFADKTGHTVGMIIVFEQMPAIPWRSGHAWLVNLLSSALLALIGSFIGLAWIPVQLRPDVLLSQALQTGESATVEFKGSLRWDQWQVPRRASDTREDERRRTAEKGVAEGIAVKTVAALLNGRSGGVLLIGVADDKRVVGLERDYESLVKQGEGGRSRDKDRDRFQLHLKDLLTARLGRDITKLYVDIAILPVDNADVAVVHARPAPSPVYAAEGKAKAFYVRVGASTLALDVEETVAYVENRWPKALWRRLWNGIHAGEV